MLWFNIGVALFVISLASLYFMPYRKIKGKIFKKLLYNFQDVTEMEYESGKTIIRFVKKRDSSWRMTSPVHWRVDSSKIRRLILKLVDLNIDDRITNGDPTNDEYDIGRNGLLHLFIGGKKVTLAFGARTIKNDDDIYITKTGDKDVLMISSSILPVLPKDADDFKNMVLFEASYPQVRSLEAGARDTNYNLIRTDAGWLLRGQNVFDDRVQPIIASLLEIEALGFENTSLKLPAKPDAFISLKVNKTTITRHFFVSEKDNLVYLVAVDGEILTVRKSDIDAILNF